MGFSFQELMIVMLIGLIVLGPERLPRIANQLGSWLGKARRMTRVMKRQLEDELSIDKDFDILPPDRTRHSNPGGYTPPPSITPQATASDDDDEKDDTYSPAHGAEDVGLGVNDDIPVDDDADQEDVMASAEEQTTVEDSDKKA